MSSPAVRAAWARIARHVPASAVAIFVLVAGLALTAFATVQVRRNVSRAQSERLAERARQTTNLFSTVTQGVAAVLTTGGVVAESTGGSPEAFRRALAARLAPTLLSNAVLFDLSGGRVRELTWIGATKPTFVHAFTPEQLRLMRQANRTGAGFVVAHGNRAGTKVLGIATSAHPGSRYLVYGEISVPRAVSFGNLKGAEFGFYLGKETNDALLATNAKKLPIGGQRLLIRLDEPGIGQRALLVYGEPTRLTLASSAPWLILAIGILTSLVVSVQIEAMRRRRDVALGLVTDLELKNAELDRQSAINRHQALHDALTGLPNRTLFRDRVEQAARRNERSGERAAVILIDLDRFKEVNDTLGHQSGDWLLETVGERLSATVRASDTVARLGGDEFGVLAGSIAHPEDALAIAEKIREALTGPVDIGGLAIEVDASFGIALHPEHGDDVDALMRHADIALYRSKAVHAPVLYSSEHDHYSPVRLQLVADLRHAIEAGQIVVYYQPQAPTTTGRIGAVEALVRWEHPELGLVPPDQFIPLAEQTGTIRPLTRYVLETALGQCRTWLRHGWRIGVAVNICARDLLDSGFPDEVLTCLEESGVEADLLELEITEDTILTDSIRAHAVMERLRKHGVRFAIDDFGAGHSSLSYLKRLPVQVLKIDKSFVLGMTENADDAVIVQSTINLGHNLRLKVVAEGVETAEIRSRLAELDCDIIQGFDLGRPLPPAEVEKLFGSPSALPAPAAPPRALRLAPGPAAPEPS